MQCVVCSSWFSKLLNESRGRSRAVKSLEQLVAGSQSVDHETRRMMARSLRTYLDVHIAAERVENVKEFFH
jgi:hypothetical protein